MRLAKNDILCKRSLHAGRTPVLPAFFVAQKTRTHGIPLQQVLPCFIMDTPLMNDDYRIIKQEPIEKRTSFRDEAWETTRFVLLALIIVIPLRLFVAQPFIVSGASMDPTFADGQYLIIDELSYHFKSPARGDVIVFKFPKDTSKYFIKRIIGLPGEVVLIDGKGYVSIKDQDGHTASLQEPYVQFPQAGKSEYALDTGEYFALGDNRSGSYDSRMWGPVPKKLIIGKTFLRLTPLSSIGVFPGQFRQSATNN